MKWPFFIAARRSLKCDRLRVHKNFMLSLVIRYVVSIVWYEPYIYGGVEEPDTVWFKRVGQVRAEETAAIEKSNWR